MRIEIHKFMSLILMSYILFHVLYSAKRRLTRINCKGIYWNGIEHPLIGGLEDMSEHRNKTLADMWGDIQGTNKWNGLLDPMNPVLKAEILRYGVFARLCYDAFDGNLCMNDYGGCKYSPDELLDNNLGVNDYACMNDYGGCKYSLDKLLDSKYYGYQVKKYLYAETDIALLGRPIKRSVWIGFIAVCTDAQEIQRLGRRDILVAWRGTQTFREWIQDITDFLVPYRLSSTATLDQGVRVEKGFENCYTSVGQDSKCARDTVRSEIKSLVDEYKEENLSVTLTGHSLGAALATLSSYHIKNILMEHPPDSPARLIPVTVFAFASPRVGNRAFALRMEELGVKVLRLVNKNDIVPKVPGILLNEISCGWLTRIFDWLPWAYFHVGVQIVLDNNASPPLKQTYWAAFKQTYWPACTHNLEVYLHLIDGYVGKGKPLRSSARDLGIPLIGPSSHSSNEIKSIKLDNGMKYGMIDR